MIIKKTIEYREYITDMHRSKNIEFDTRGNIEYPFGTTEDEAIKQISEIESGASDKIIDNKHHE